MFLYNEQRRILLIDANSRKLNLRATVLRNYEIEVHTASSLEHAESLWRAIPYDLVLLAALENSEEAATVSARIQESKPRQRFGLLVGPPAYIREVGPRPKHRGRIQRESAAALSRPENSPAPQWQEIVHEVAGWYDDEVTLLALRRLSERVPAANAS